MKLAFVGDGNNVAHSLMLTRLRLGMDFAIGCPDGYDAESGHRGAGRGAWRRIPAARLHDHARSAEAVAGAHAVYTDVWASMGQEQEAVKRDEGVSRRTR